MKGRDMFFRASGDIKEVESQFKLVSTPSEIERVKVKSSIDRLESYDEEDSATNTVIVDPEPIAASIIPKDPNNDYEHLPEEEMTSPGESTGPVISNKAITVDCAKKVGLPSWYTQDPMLPRPQVVIDPSLIKEFEDCMKSSNSISESETNNDSTTPTQTNNDLSKKKKTWGLFIGVIVIGAILIIASQAIKKEKQTA